MSDSLPNDWTDVGAPAAAGGASPHDDWVDVQSGGPVHGGGLRAANGEAAPAESYVGATGIPSHLVPEAIHDLGVAGRAAEVGLAKGTSILYDPAAALLNLGSRGVNEVYSAVRSPTLPELITGKQDKPLIPYIQPLAVQAENAADAAGLPQADTPGGKVAASSLEGATSVLPTMGAGAIMKSAESAPAVVRMLGDMLTAAPAVQAVSAAGGSAAGELAKQAGAGTAGQIGASLVGGLGTGGGSIILRDGIPAGWRLVQQLTEDLLSPNAANKRAGEALLRASSDPATLPARLEAAASAPSTPGAQPTTGQAAADPGLLAAQNGLQSTEPRAAGLIANRNAANNTAWQGTLDAMAPHGAGADAVQGAVRSAFQGFQGATDQMIGRATQRAQDALAALGDHITPERAGTIIRQAVTEEYNAARGATRTAYNAVDPTAQSSVPVQPLYAPAANTVNARYAESTFGTPDDLNRILTRLRDTNHTSVNAIDAIRKDLGDIAGDQSRSKSDRDIATQLRGQIDNYLDSVASGGVPEANLTPEQVAQLGAARDARTFQGGTFERGSVGNVTKTKAFGEQTVPDSGVAAEFLFKGSGSPEAVQQFMAAVGNRPAAVSALQNYAATQLREFATNPDGTINPQRLTRWVQDHRPVLEQFPELNGRIGSAMRAQGLVDSLTGRQTRAIDDVQNSALGYFLGDTNPDAAVAKILNSSSSHADMDRLLNVIGHDQDAMAGLRRAIVDHMLGKSTNAGTDITGTNLLSQAKFGANLDRYGPILDRVFSPDHVAAMRQIQADLDRQQLSTAAKALGSNTVQNLSAASLLSNVSKGTIPLDNPLVQNLMRPYSWILKLPEQRVREILTDAMLDPELALRLVQGVKPASSASLSLALRQRAGALGIGSAESTQAGEPRQLPSPTGTAVGTAVGSSQPPQHLASGGVVTEHKDLRSLLADKRPLKQILAETKAKQAREKRLADGGVVAQPKGGRGQATQQFSAVDPSLAPTVQAVFADNPALARHSGDFAVITGKPMGEGTGQLESYPPDELYNPIPGKATTEVYNPDPAGLKGLITGDMLHRLGAVDAKSGQPVDQGWRSLKTSFLQTMTPQQQADNQRVYGWYQAKGDPRSFEQFMDQSRGDEYLMGALTPDAGDYWRGRPGSHQPSMYTPQQDEILNKMRGYLKGYATGGVVTKPTGTGHRDSPVKVVAPHHAAIAGDKVAVATPGQKGAGNYAHGHITWNGLQISIETPKGGTRTAKDGTWEVPNFPAHYGYLKRTVGADSEHVDVFFGDHPESQRVWVIDQVDPAVRRFDEHKVMLACITPKEARDLYAAAFSDGSGHARVGAFTMMTVKQFKNWLKRGKRTKPLGHLPPPRSGASRAAQTPTAVRQLRPTSGDAAAVVANAISGVST